MEVFRNYYGFTIRGAISGLAKIFHLVGQSGWMGKLRCWDLLVG